MVAKDSRVDREELLVNLKSYLDLAGLSSNWAAIEKMPSGKLVDNLSMICPFDINEKQALLESLDIAERSKIVISLLKMWVIQSDVGHVYDQEHRMH